MNATPDSQTPHFLPEELSANAWIQKNWHDGFKIAGADSRYTAFWAYVAAARDAKSNLTTTREQLEEMRKEREKAHAMAQNLMPMATF